jgi:ABC-2 type transport system ATP-binding protein
MEAILTRGLSRSFGGNYAVRDFTVSVPGGELFGLVGPDGAGKSTVMRLLTSILDPTAGEAFVAGFSTVREAADVKRSIGYVSQRFGLYPDLAVAENIDFYADLYGVGKAFRKIRGEELLEFTRMSAFKKRRAGALSGGMKQKLGLMCALIHTPKVLLLDEPTNGVDPVSRREFWRILNRLLGEGVTVFVSTAYLDEAERCNRVGLLYKGALIACDSPEEVKKRMRGALVEIRSANPRRAAEILKSAYGPDSVALFGDRVHLKGESPEAAESAARKALSDAGVVDAEIRAIPPTLEDIFIFTLTGAEAK